MNGITRRQAAAIALGSTVALNAQAPPDWLQAARDAKRAAADILGKFDLQMSVEPAFQFKA